MRQVLQDNLQICAQLTPMIHTSVAFIATNVVQADVIEQFTIVGYILWAMLIGGMIGLEREKLAKAPGLRTHMLIAGASTLIVSVGMAITSATGDPSRSIHGVVTGIGFLCAGAIFQAKDGNVSGLTTAASMLYTAAIGCAVGAGYGITASLSTFLGIIVLRVLGKIRYRLAHAHDGHTNN